MFAPLFTFQGRRRSVCHEIEAGTVTDMHSRRKKYGFRRKRAKLHGPEALAIREHILGPSPWGGHEHNSLGCEFLKRGALDLAIAELEKAVAINPWQPVFKINLAHAYLQKGKFKEASKNLDEALEQQPRSAAGWFAYAILCEKLSQNEDALRFYRRCLECSPEGPIRRQAAENLNLLLGCRQEAERPPNSRNDQHGPRWNGPDSRTRT